MSKGALAQLVALASILAILGMGLCLSDAVHPPAEDLCLSVLTTTIGLLVAFSLTPTGHVLPALARVYHRYPQDLPAPPPKA